MQLDFEKNDLGKRRTLRRQPLASRFSDSHIDGLCPRYWISAKRGRVGGLPNDDASTHFGGRTRGGRLAGWRAGGRRACGWLAGWLATSWRLAASELTAGGDNRAGGRQSNAEGPNAEGPAPRPAQSERQSARSRPMPWCRARRRARRRLSPRNACRHLQPTRRGSRGNRTP